MKILAMFLILHVWCAEIVFTVGMLEHITSGPAYFWRLLMGIMSGLAVSYLVWRGAKT